MQINSSGSIPTPVVRTASDAGRVAGRAAEAASPAEEGSFAMTDQLTSLLSAVRQAPEVRAAVVESVAARLASGEFATPEAASDAARAMLGDGS